MHPLVLAGCQQLPSDWQQQEVSEALLQHALDILPVASSNTISTDADTCADTSSDKELEQYQQCLDHGRHLCLGGAWAQWR